MAASPALATDGSYFLLSALLVVSLLQQRLRPELVEKSSGKVRYPNKDVAYPRFKTDSISVFEIEYFASLKRNIIALLTNVTSSLSYNVPLSLTKRPCMVI